MRKGAKYISDDRLAKIVAQARAQGRAELAAELRHKHRLDETGDSLARLQAWVAGALWQARHDDGVGKLPSVARALETLAAIEVQLHEIATDSTPF